MISSPIATIATSMILNRGRYRGSLPAKPAPKGFPWAKEKIVLTANIEWECPVEAPEAWTSKDGMLRIEGSKWYFKAGIKYDGCSGVSSGPAVDPSVELPVKSLTDQPIGILWFACLIHDLCYRYLGEEGFPFSKENGDWFLKYLCKKAQWRYSKLYYIGVTILGWPAAIKHYLKNLWDSL